MRFSVAFLGAVALIASPALAGRAVKTTQPLAPEIIGASHVVETRVVLDEATAANFTKLEAKAAAKRAEAKLPPPDAAASSATRISRDSYPTLPIAQMLPLVVDDQTKDWGLTGGKPVRLVIQLDTLKTADAGMALLLSSTDELAGLVAVEDPVSGSKLGEFYVDVLNMRAGLLGLAMRGSGVREKLAFEFAKRISQQLSGSKSKPKSKS